MLVIAVVCVIAAFTASCGETTPEEHTHTYGDWVTTAATCTVDGSRTRTCTSCNAPETQVIEALGYPSHFHALLKNSH